MKKLMFCSALLLAILLVPILCKSNTPQITVLNTGKADCIVV